MKKWLLCVLSISAMLIIGIVKTAANLAAAGVWLGVAAIVTANAIIIIIARTISRDRL